MDAIAAHVHVDVVHVDVVHVDAVYVHVVHVDEVVCILEANVDVVRVIGVVDMKESAERRN